MLALGDGGAAISQKSPNHSREKTLNKQKEGAVQLTGVWEGLGKGNNTVYWKCWDVMNYREVVFLTPHYN